MNDDELIMAVRESFSDVRSGTAVERIVSRSRAVRARRRATRVAAALGAAAAMAAFAVNMALPASHPFLGPAVRVTGWTVTRQPDGGIQVTLREATDPAGLQRILRADGVPASVTFTGHKDPACRSDPYSPTGLTDLSPFTLTIADTIVIYPSLLPPGDGLQIWTPEAPGAPGESSLFVGLVYASPQCTGS